MQCLLLLITTRMNNFWKQQSNVRVRVKGEIVFLDWGLLHKRCSLHSQASSHTVFSFLEDNFGKVHELHSSGEGLMNAHSHHDSRAACAT